MSDGPSATYPVDTICKLCDLTPRRVQQLTAEGVLVKVERGRYDLIRSVRGYIQYLKERALKADQVPEDEWKKRKVRAEAETAEHELAVLRSDYIEKGKIRDRDERVASTIRAKLRAIPSGLAAKLTGKQSLAERHKIIAKAIDEALEELSALGRTG